MSENLLRLFRRIALFEGISFLILLGIAMPLKYLAHIPIGVRVVGMAHGVLFVMYVVLVAALLVTRRWSFGWAAAAFGLSLVPFGTFLLERRIQRDLPAAGG